VIVVGGGIAGVVAALELIERGRRVVLVDRDTEARLGGLARESFGGMLFVDTPIQRRHGIRDSAELALADWLRFGELSRIDGWPYLWAEAYVEDCRRDVFEWLKAQGIRFLPMPQWVERDGNSVPRWHIVWGTGAVLTSRLVDNLQRHPQRRNLSLLFGHRVEKLLFENGRVTGCSGVLEGGDEPFELRGSEVLVASGGINGSLEQVRRYWPREWGAAPQELLNGAHRFADGMLHGAVARVGGQIANLDRMWNYAAGVRHWLPRKPHHGLSLVPPRSALWVDAGGRRFEPPLLAGLDTSAQVARIAGAGGTSWQILNRRIAMKELAVSGAEFNPSIREWRPLAFLRDMLLGNRWLVDTMLSNCPDFIVADTLSGLVQKMNRLTGDDAVSLANVTRALDAYETALDRRDLSDPQVANIATARQWKGDRLRTANFASILDPANGPLIAIRERIISRKSLGGMVTDLRGRVIDNLGFPIPGLFAAGEATGFGGGGMNGRRALEGTFLGGCIYSARRAARALADTDPENPLT
jgi:predicted oxidoreductase